MIVGTADARGVEKALWGDGALLVGHHGLDELTRQRIDQPGLPPGELEGHGLGLGTKDLARLLRVLLIKGRDFTSGEIGQAQGVALDVEGRGCAKGGVLAAGHDLVVAHVTQANQGDGMGKALAMNGLAVILGERGRFREAAEIFRENLALRRAKLGEHHANVATSLRSLGTTLYNAGDLDAADPFLRQAHTLRLELFGPEHTSVASTLLALGRLEHARGRLDEAGEHLSEALRIRRRNLGGQHHRTAIARMELAAVLLDRGETATAGVLLPRVLETLYRIRPADDWQVAEAESLLGVLLASSGRSEAAEVCLYEAHATLERQRGAHALDTRAAHRRLEHFHAARK